MSQHNDEQRNRRHREAMKRKKAHVDARIAEATIDKGLLVILTGNGKGKSSSAFGMLARGVGHGMRCGVVQFIKGQWECGEHLLFHDHPLVSFHVMSTGFTWETQDREADRVAAERTWADAEKLLSDPDCELVLLDELTYMITYGYLDRDRVTSALRDRPDGQHVIITGRNASQVLTDMADTVSEVQDIKHAFNSGIRVQKGVDY